MTAQAICENLETVRKEIFDCAVKHNRDHESVKLVAVSKLKPHDAVMAAYGVGQRDFGENRMPEFVDKHAALPDDIRWHFIGHLQSNKVRHAVACSDLIHAVDSAKLIDRIGRIAGELGKCQPILLEANISGEESKFGSSLSGLEDLVQKALSTENVELCGFMTMAPFNAGHDELVKTFSTLRDFRDAMEVRHGVTLPELSMGMSGDYEEAIECGATYVRIGTAIFGAR